jgi:hypothetical protein
MSLRAPPTEFDELTILVEFEENGSGGGKEQREKW